MIKLLEPELLVKCRKEDYELVKSLIPECETEFFELMAKEAAEGEYKTHLKLLDNEFMTPEEGGECGGIIMCTTNRKIVCTNTLKSRLDLCFEELRPHNRKLWFPKKPTQSR